MKHLRVIILTLLAAAALAATAAAASSFQLEIRAAGGGYTERAVTAVSLACDGKTLETDVPAYLADGRTMVPVRVISEQLGASVTWRQDTQQVQIESGDKTIVLTIGSADASVNGGTVRLYDGVPATLVRKDGVSRTMVPLRFVSEQLGAEISWDADTYTASIATAAAQETTYAVAAPALKDGTISVALTGAGDAQPTVFALTGRVVIDFPGGVFSGSSSGSLAVNGAAVKDVRFNQFDSGYEGHSRVARVVLDMNDGYGKDDLTVTLENGVLSVVQPAGAPAPETPAETVRPLIVLDPGHGGSDTGAPYFGYYEKDIDLAVTLKVGALLAAAGYRVEYTRTTDATVSLAGRSGLANTVGADIFVCIHANAYPPKPEVCGLETYYLIGGERGKLLAEDIHAALLSAAGMDDRGVRTANYYVLRHTDMPAVLVETGYLTNEDECARLASEDYQNTLADGIARGIETYFSEIG